MNHLVFGHGGMVGSAIVTALKAVDPDNHVVLADRAFDLRSSACVFPLMFEMKEETPINSVWLCAARVGGIIDNSLHPVDYLLDNLMIQINVIRAAYEVANVKRVVFMGSSCIYPRDAPQPIPESALMTGPLEETNRAYALAKIAGIELLEGYRKQSGRDYLALMPCNLYGPGDRYDAERSHVIPALIMKLHAAKDSGAASVRIGGDGSPLREFLHVDDLAAAAVALNHFGASGLLNVGSGGEISIASLVELLVRIIGFEGRIEWDDRIPNGTPRKLLDSSRARGIAPYFVRSLRDGLTATYQEYLKGIKA